jgi:ATP-dependent RNA helicase DHX37/DHR1
MNDDRDCDRSIIDLNNYPIVPSMRDDDTINSDDDDDVIMMSSDEDDDEEAESIGDPLQVLPLYATLSPSEQAKVFQISPEGGRVCVVATNVAETSITIPHIRYVVDSGKVKRKFYDKLTGVSTFRVVWISKASADQRAGRSGRTGPGHCYRLYSSAVFQHEFPQFSEPEISQRPIDDLVLQMKAMNIIKIINFPFPTPPTREALRGAEKLLISLGALDEAGLSVTGLGEAMSALPISPRYSKMLCLSRQNGCLPYMVVIVAGLSVRELFVAVGDETTPADDTPTTTGKLSATKRKWIGQGEWLMLGDLMVLLRSVGAYESSDNKLDCCRKLGLRMRAMDEVRKLRHQLTNIVNVLVPDAELFMDPKMSPPTQDQAKFLRQIVLTGSGDHVARKMDTNSMNSDDQKKYRNAYECMLCDGPVYIHPSSILSNVLPQFVIFQDLMETNKLYMKEVVAIEWEWLPRLLPNCCSFSKPLDGVRPSYDATEGHVTCHMTTTFGPWVLPSISLPYPAGIDRYKWFAVYLLQGDVFPPLKQFSSNLLCPPITMTKTWAKLHNRTQVLLAGLAAKEASTRDKILLIWQEEPQYLLAEYMQWLPQNKHLLIKELWPPND